MTDDVFNPEHHIDSEKLSALVREQCSWVEHLMKSHPDSLTPCLLVLALDGKSEEMKEERTMCMIPEGMNDHDSKRGIMNMLGKKFFADTKVPLALAFCSEAWHSDQDINGPEMRPIDDPNRTEVIIACGMSITKLVVHTRATVQRDAAQAMTLGKWDELETDGEVNLLVPFFKGFWEAAHGKYILPRN